MTSMVKIGAISCLLLTANFAMANETPQEVIPMNPKTVASFDLGVVDSLNALEAPVKALPKQSLPSYLAKYKADQYEDVGGLKTPNIEKLKQIKPDLIIISARQQAKYDELAAIAPTVNLSTNPKDYEKSFKNNMLLLGKVFGKIPKISTALAIIDKQADTLKEQANQSANKALIVVHYKGRLVASEESNYAGLIHGWLGVNRTALDSVKKDNNSERLMLTSKQIAELNPDILFVIDRNEAIGEGKVDKQQLEDSNIKQTNAYKNHKIIYLTPDLWYLSGSGLESIKLQMTEVAQAFK